MAVINLLLIWMLFTSGVMVSYSVRDRLSFDYHRFNVGPQCTTVRWNYLGEDCSPVKYTLQGFYPEDITSNPTPSPRISLNSNSNSSLFTFPTGFRLEGNALFFRIRGFDAEGVLCNASSSDAFYNFSSPHENGWQTLCLTEQRSSFCTQLPPVSGPGIFVWPKTNSSLDDYCLRIPLIWNTDCLSNYRFTYNSVNNTVCLQNSSLVWERAEPLRAYYIQETQGVQIQSFSALYWIIRQDNCSQIRMPNRSNFLSYSVNNYTVILNDEVSSSVHIDVTYDTSTITPQIFIWTHNGLTIDTGNNSRITIHNNGSLTLYQVEPLDAGSYGVSLSNDVGCDSADFNVMVEYLNISESTISLTEDALIAFQCVATGFPEALLTWQSGTGDVIPQSEYRSSSEEDEFSTTLLSTLSVDEDTCVLARGYACVFTNGGSSVITKSAFNNCPPGPPGGFLQVQFTSSNSSLCLDAYSHPNYPVEYTVNITGNNLNNTATYRPLVLPWHSAVNITECVTLDFEVPSDLCGPVLMSVMATNALGTHRYDFNFTKVQICLEGASSCDSLNAEAHVESFTEELLTYIRDQCQCSFTLDFYRPRFICSEDDPSLITFTGHLLAFRNDQVRDQLIAVIERWISTVKSVKIQGEVLALGQNCPVSVSVSNDPQCPTLMMSSLNYAILGGAPAGVFLVFLTFLLIIICVLAIKRKRHSKSKTIPPKSGDNLWIADTTNDYSQETQAQAQHIPMYEEIPATRNDVATEQSLHKFSSSVMGNPPPCSTNAPSGQEYAEIKDAVKVDTVKNELYVSGMQFTKCEAYGTASVDSEPYYY